MRQRVVDPRMYFKVEEDINSKAQQLKTLGAREKFLEQKLASAETNAEEVMAGFLESPLVTNIMNNVEFIACKASKQCVIGQLYLMFALCMYAFYISVALY